jgi:hypothetical protein
VEEIAVCVSRAADTFSGRTRRKPDGQSGSMTVTFAI